MSGVNDLAGELSLVVGGSGFVGIELVRQLVAAGRKVRVLDLRPLDDNELERIVDFVKGDVRDIEDIRGACKGATKIFHLAALVPITRAGKEFWDVNVGGTENVIRVAAEIEIDHLLHLSSSAIYGIPTEIPISETTTPNPMGDYGRSKYDAELVVQRGVEAGLSVAAIRPRTVVGHGRLGIFQLLFDMIANQRAITILGSGNQDFQLVSNRDLASAMIATSDQRATGFFNVGAERFTNLRDDLNELASKVDSKSRVRGIPAWIVRPILKVLDKLRLAPFIDYHYNTMDKAYWFDTSKIRTDLGWTAQDSNVDMLVDSYRWYVESRISNDPGRSTHRSEIARRFARIITGPSAAGSQAPK